MKKTNSKSGYKRFMSMTPAERAKDVARFDRSMVINEATDPSPAEKAKMDKFIKKITGRPKVGQGAQRVLVTVERGLLGQADALAKRKHMSRSELIAHGLRRMLTKA